MVSHHHIARMNHNGPPGRPSPDPVRRRAPWQAPASDNPTRGGNAWGEALSVFCCYGVTTSTPYLVFQCGASHGVAPRREATGVSPTYQMDRLPRFWWIFLVTGICRLLLMV